MNRPENYWKSYFVTVARMFAVAALVLVGSLVPGFAQATGISGLGGPDSPEAFLARELAGLGVVPVSLQEIGQPVDEIGLSSGDEPQKSGKPSQLKKKKPQQFYSLLKVRLK